MPVAAAATPISATISIGCIGFDLDYSIKRLEKLFVQLVNTIAVF